MSLASGFEAFCYWLRLIIFVFFRRLCSLDRSYVSRNLVFLCIFKLIDIQVFKINNFVVLIVISYFSTLNFIYSFMLFDLAQWLSTFLMLWPVNQFLTFWWLQPENCNWRLRIPFPDAQNQIITQKLYITALFGQLCMHIPR